MTGPSDPLRGHPARPRVRSLQRSPPGAAHPPPAPRDERTDVELEREHHTPRAELREGADAVPSQAADRTARSRRSASTRARPARRDRQAPGCVPRSEPHPGIWLMAARIDAFGGEWSDGVCVAGALFDSRRVRAAGLQFACSGMKCPAPSSRRPCGLPTSVLLPAPLGTKEELARAGRPPPGHGRCSFDTHRGTPARDTSGLRRGAMQVSSAVRIIRTGDVRSPATAPARVKTPRGTRIARWYCPESHTTCRRRSEDAREWPG